MREAAKDIIAFTIVCFAVFWFCIAFVWCVAWIGRTFDIPVINAATCPVKK